MIWNFWVFYGLTFKCRMEKYSNGVLSRKSWKLSGNRYGMSNFWKFTLKNFTSALHDLSRRISEVLSGMLHLKVSKFWDSEFDFSLVFSFVLKHEINQSLANIILKQQKKI